MTTTTQETTTPATSSAPQCCKCERPATLRFAWPWGAVDHCCELDRQTVANNFAALSGGKSVPKFEPLTPPASEADTVPPPRPTLAGEHHETTAKPGAEQLTSSTAHNALAEGTIALVNITSAGRFMLRRPGQGDVAGGTGELAVVLATLGLIPALATAAPPIIQQSTQATPLGAASALATAGAANRPPPPPALGPPPPIRPPSGNNPLLQRQRVAGRLHHHAPQIPPAVAPGAPPARFAGELEHSPPPASPAPPVQAAPTGGEASSVVEGDEPPTKPDP